MSFPEITLQFRFCIILFFNPSKVVTKWNYEVCEIKGSSMWLSYGVNQENKFVSIEDSPRGKTQLKCPYCGGELTAKKGKIKAHHFAHVGETCNPVKNGNINLPLFWGFDLILSRQRLKYLKHLESIDFEPKVFYTTSGRVKENSNYKFLKKKGVITALSDYRYELTDLGKVILKKLTLGEFSQLQEKLCQDRFLELKHLPKWFEDRIKEKIEFQKTDDYLNKPIAYQIADNDTLKGYEEALKQSLVDFKIYLLQYQRVLSSNLYFLKITTSNEVFYKIGVTSRDIQERIKEISNDLSKIFDEFSVSLLNIWLYRGNIENYFKYRYEDFQYSLGNLTEYFRFPDIELVLQDLNTIKPKHFCQLERDIIDEKMADNFLLSQPSLKK